jgi:hypothetical protein
MPPPTADGLMMQLVYDAARLLTAAVTRSIIFILHTIGSKLTHIMFPPATTTAHSSFHFQFASSYSHQAESLA